MNAIKAEDSVALKARRQEAFDKTWEHFITNDAPFSLLPPEERNYSLESICMYSGPGGTRCAFGLQLTDAELIQVGELGLEGMGAETVIRTLELFRFYIEYSHPTLGGYKQPDEFYQHLQEAHDRPAEHFASLSEEARSPELKLTLIRGTLTHMGEKWELKIPLGGSMTQQAFHVFVGRKHLDTVFASDHPGYTPQEVVDDMRKSLIEHDGYPSNIRVVNTTTGKRSPEE